MTSFIRVSQKLVFHQSKCICAIKRILSTTAMYVSSSSFMYLRISWYCDACLNSSDLRVGVTTLLNTIQFLFLSSILKTRLNEVYPNVLIALWIRLNCPMLLPALKWVSANWSWSNRSNMTDSRLSSLAMLSIEASCVRCQDLADYLHWPCCQLKLHVCAVKIWMMS